jgi:hypothetical protein
MAQRSGMVRFWWKRLWASPYTIVGITLGLVGKWSGGSMRIVDGVIECEGPFLNWYLSHLPVKAAAMTLGHTVIGCTTLHLEFTRRHERVHVRQYERWGPFMAPAYLAFSAVLWLRGRDPYLENPFEIEAYEPANHRDP